MENFLTYNDFFIEALPYQRSTFKIVMSDKRYLFARNLRIYLTPKTERIIIHKFYRREMF